MNNLISTSINDFFKKTNMDFSDDYEDSNNKYINVYTDGACINNGKPNAKAGYGIYFSPNNPKNVSKRIIGKQTNQVAELTAIIEAYKILNKEIDEKININIYSDSIYAIRCCTTYGDKCKKNNWKNNKNKDIPNLELVKNAHKLFYNKNNIKFNHVKAHTGYLDEHSIGNENADRLANLAIGIKNKNSKKNNKIYLSVKYENKDKAKKLGAKWDSKNKKWYIMNNFDKKEEILSEFSPI